MLPDAAVSAATGVALTPYAAFWSPGTLEGAGGLRCAWRSASAPVTAVVAYALPEASVPAGYDDGTTCDDTACQAIRRADGVWYAVEIPHATGDVDRTAAVEGLIAELVTAGGSWPAPVAPASADGTWTDLPACDAIGTEIDLARAGAEGPLEMTEAAPPAAPLLPGLEVALGQVRCAMTLRLPNATGDMSEARLTLVLSPGGGPWFSEGVAAGGGTIDPAADPQMSAVALPDIVEGADGMFGSDGANTAMLAAGMGYGADQLQPLLTEIYAVLDK